MNIADTPKPILEFIETTNSGNTDKFLANFTENATLEDWGRKFSGKENIAKWNQTDNIGKKSHFELLSISTNDQKTFTTQLKVSGEGFNGDSPMIFTVDGNKLSDVTIPSS